MHANTPRSPLLSLKGIEREGLNVIVKDIVACSSGLSESTNCAAEPRVRPDYTRNAQEETVSF